MQKVETLLIGRVNDQQDQGDTVVSSSYGRVMLNDNVVLLDLPKESSIGCIVDAIAAAANIAVVCTTTDEGERIHLKLHVTMEDTPVPTDCTADAEASVPIDSTPFVSGDLVKVIDGAHSDEVVKVHGTYVVDGVHVALCMDATTESVDSMFEIPCYSLLHV